MNSRKPLTYLLVLGLVTVPGLSSATPFSSLEERMTHQEFSEAGLSKLSDDELARLNAWIRARSLAAGDDDGAVTAAAAECDCVAEVAAATAAAPAARPDGPIETYIAGTFSGWNGPVELTMGDGSVWEVVEPRTFYASTVENPSVVIRSRFLGSGWRMQIEGYNTGVTVRRVR